MSENEPENNDRGRRAPTDRAVRETGAPAGVAERRITASGRRATDTAKVPCPACRGSESCVISTRPARRAEAIRRRRECAACFHRYSTWETINAATSLAPTVVELAHRLQLQSAMGTYQRADWWRFHLLIRAALTGQRDQARSRATGPRGDGSRALGPVEEP